MCSALTVPFETNRVTTRKWLNNFGDCFTENVTVVGFGEE